MRLIAYMQNGIRADEESIKFEIEVGLPKFEDGPLAISAGPPQPSAGQPQHLQKPATEALTKSIADALPSFDDLDDHF